MSDKPKAVGKLIYTIYDNGLVSSTIEAVDKSINTAKWVGKLLYVVNEGLLEDYNKKVIQHLSEQHPGTEDFYEAIILEWFKSIKEAKNKPVVMPHNVFGIGGGTAKVFGNTEE